MSRDDYDNMNGRMFKAILTGNAYNMVQVVGHASKSMLDYNVPQESMVEADELYRYAAICRKRHLPKFKMIDLEECYVCQDHYLVNALLEIANDVYGFEGETVNPNTFALGVRYHYTKPFHNPLKMAVGDSARNYKKKGNPPQ